MGVLLPASTGMIAFLLSSAGVSVQPLARDIDPLHCMGNWYVQVAIPTPFDEDAFNGLEQWTWNAELEQINVQYTWNTGSFDGEQTIIYQQGRVNPQSEYATLWQVRPWLGLFYLPIWLGFVVIDIDPVCSSYIVCSAPDTTSLDRWMYIMTRNQTVSDEFLRPLELLAEEAGWNVSEAQRVPQQTRAVPEQHPPPTSFLASC